MLLSEAIEALALATRANSRSKATVRAYREKLGYLVEFLGDAPVEGITVHDLRRYVASLWEQNTLHVGHRLRQAHDGSLSPFTVAGRVRAFKRLFNFLVEEGVISESPARRIETPNPKGYDPKGISDRDFLAILATCEDSDVIDRRDRAIMCFLFDTGCRVGGLCGLRLRDVDLNAMRAQVTEKGGKRRSVVYTEPTRDALISWLAVHPYGCECDSVFVRLGSHRHDPLAPNGVGQMLAIRGKRAGVTGPVNPHSFRHAFAINFLLDGGDIGVLSKLMGHESVDITIRFYGRFAIGQLQEQHKRHSAMIRLVGGGN